MRGGGSVSSQCHRALVQTEGPAAVKNERRISPSQNELWPYGNPSLRAPSELLTQYESENVCCLYLYRTSTFI